MLQPAEALLPEKMHMFSIGLPVRSNHHEKKLSHISVPFFGRLWYVTGVFSMYQTN